MNTSVDRYLDTLLTFIPKQGGSRFGKDYVALVHVPAAGPEKVYSLVCNEPDALLTVASYKKPLWEEAALFDGAECPAPELDALQAGVALDHPAFDFFDRQSLQLCDNYSDGAIGTDYFLLLWQRDGEAGVVECYEPYSRDDYAWASVIGAMQTLSSQYEFMVK